MNGPQQGGMSSMIAALRANTPQAQAPVPGLQFMPNQANAPTTPMTSYNRGRAMMNPTNLTFNPQRTTLPVAPPVAARVDPFSAAIAALNARPKQAVPTTSKSPLKFFGKSEPAQPVVAVAPTKRLSFGEILNRTKR